MSFQSYHADNRSKQVFSKHIGKYIYTVENNGFGNYRIIKKISLEGMRDYLSEGYAEYITNPDNLKKHDPDLFEYFEGIT